MVGEKFESRTRIAVLKVAGGQMFRVLLLRHEPLGHIVHWLDGKSLLCPGFGCPACVSSLGARWVGTMPVRLLSPDGKNRTMLVEFSGDAWARTAGLLRLEGVAENVGYCCNLSRRQARSGLLCDPVVEFTQGKLAPMPDWMLLDALATLHGLPSCPQNNTLAQWEEDAFPVAMAKVKRAVVQDLGS